MEMSALTRLDHLLLALALGVALCWAGTARADGVSTDPASITSTYHPRTLGYIAGKGGMPTEIIGNPFGIPRRQLEETVNRLLAGSHPGPRFPFFSEVPEGFSSPYRVVLLLNQPGPHSGARLCRDGRALRAAETLEASPAGGEIWVEAAFCAREVHIASVRGRVAGVGGPFDGSFKRLLSQVGHELFPVSNPERHGGGNKYY